VSHAERLALGGTASVLLLLAGMSIALAHQLDVLAKVDGDNVVVEARFAADGPARSATVRVYDGENALILVLSTDEDGTVSFPIETAETGLRIEVDAGDGHSDYRILTPADLAGETFTD
jgi:hypothetical protein